jgi:uncharacterized membrane protein
MAHLAQEKPPQTSTEENVYTAVYRVLLGGMLVSSALFAAGIVRALLQHTFFPLSAAWVRQHYSVSRVLHGLAGLEPMSLMLVATVLLILTPVTRVVISICAFMIDRDWKYVVITSVVLVIMVMTAVAGVLGLR